MLLSSDPHTGRFVSIAEVTNHGNQFRAATSGKSRIRAAVIPAAHGFLISTLFAGRLKLV